MTFLFFKEKKPRSKAFVYSGITLLLSAVLLFLSRNAEGFAQWYAIHIFPLIPNTIGRLFSPIPFSIFEVALYLVLTGGSVISLLFLYFILKRPSGFKDRISFLIRISICAISSLFLLFTLACAINYSRDSFAATYGLPVRYSTNDELKALTHLLVTDLNELAPQLEFSEEGLLVLDPISMRQDAKKSMKKIGARYATLSGYYPSPKPILYSSGMSYLGITGIYSPFTLEANYNQNISPYLIPYTVCHELAHLKGYMKEEEAGFIAYEACRNSTSKEFQYSGALNALVYTLNALYANISMDEFKAFYDQIPLQAKMELQHSRLYWKDHTSPITAVARSANDSYLIANAQEAGTKSYGVMVDLLLASYADKLKEDQLL